MDLPIHYFAYDIDFTLSQSPNISNWLHQVIIQHHREVAQINYIFCSDSYLLSLNQQYLGHDYLTDILTFPYHETEKAPLHSDIYISIDRVYENADIYQVSFEDELHRVMVHGILHLLGYDDRQASDKQLLKQKEEFALKMRAMTFKP